MERIPQAVKIYGCPDADNGCKEEYAYEGCEIVLPEPRKRSFSFDSKAESYPAAAVTAEAMLKISTARYSLRTSCICEISLPLNISVSLP